MLLLILLSVPLVMAVTVDDYDVIITNSGDWKDVYSGELFSKLHSIPSYYVTSEIQAQNIVNGLPLTYESILLIESETRRISPTLERMLTSKGYQVTVMRKNDLSFSVVDDDEVDSLIVVDSSFPSNALAVAPYATATRSWVLFTGGDEQKIIDFIDNKKPEKILLYGPVSSFLLSQMPEDIKIINRGNRFDNNLALVDEFLLLTDTNQVLLSNGGFIEEGLFTHEFPVLLIGSSAPPRQVETYLAESDFKVGVVIGPETVPVAQLLKRRLESTYEKEMSMIVKLAQTSRDPAAVNELESLDLFAIPTPSVKIELGYVQYNLITGQLEILFSNTGDIGAYYYPTLTLQIDGETIVVEPSEDYYYLDNGQSETLLFPLKMQRSSDVSGNLVVVFGDSPSSFEYSVSKDINELDFVSVDDRSLLEVVDAIYSPKNNAFVLQVRNTGAVTSYIDLSLVDVIIGGQKVSFDSPKIYTVKPEQTVEIPIYVELSDVDINANSVVDYSGKYGQRQNALIKRLDGSIAVRVVTDYTLYIAVVVALVLVLLILLGFKRRKKYK